MDEVGHGDVLEHCPGDGVDHQRDHGHAGALEKREAGEERAHADAEDQQGEQHEPARLGIGELRLLGGEQLGEHVVVELDPVHLRATAGRHLERVVEPGQPVSADQDDLAIDRVSGNGVIEDIREGVVTALLLDGVGMGREVDGRHAELVDVQGLRPGLADRRSVRAVDGEIDAPGVGADKEVLVGDIADRVQHRQVAGRLGDPASGGKEQRQRAHDPVVSESDGGRPELDVLDGLLAGCQWFLKVGIQASECADGNLVDSGQLDLVVAEPGAAVALADGQNDRDLGGHDRLLEVLVAAALAVFREADVEDDHRGPVLRQVVEDARVPVTREWVLVEVLDALVVDAHHHHVR